MCTASQTTANVPISIRNRYGSFDESFSQRDTQIVYALRKLFEDEQDAATAEWQLRLLATLGPAFWMIGKAQLGLDLARRVVSDHTDPDRVPMPTATNERTDELTIDTPYTLGTDLQRETLSNLSSAVAPSVPSELLMACCLDGAGTNAYACTAYGEASSLHTAALSICERYLQQQQVGNDSTFGPAATLLRSRALDGLGRVCRESGDYARSFHLHVMAADAAASLCAQGVKRSPVYFRPEPHACVANAVSNAGVAAFRLGDMALARRCHEEARRLRGPIGDLRGLSSSLGNLALLCADPSAALELYLESLSLRVRLNDTWGIAGSHRAIATQLTRRGGGGDVESARQHLAAALGIFPQVGDLLGVAETLESLGLLRLGEPEKAAKLLGGAVGVRIRCGAAADAVTGHAEAAALRTSHAEAWEAGVAMSVPMAMRLGRLDAGLEP